MKLARLLQMPRSYEPGLLPAEYVVEPKLKGLRCIFYRERFRTHHDQVVPVASASIIAAKDVLRGLRDPSALDGIFVGRPANDEESGKRVLKGAFHVFDIVLANGQRGNGARSRQHELKEAMLSRDYNLSGLALVTPLALSPLSHEELIGIATSQLAEGHDGVIIKDAVAFYRHGKSDAWLKLTEEEVA